MLCKNNSVSVPFSELTFMCQLRGRGTQRRALEDWRPQAIKESRPMFASEAKPA